jgi:glycosyltransferase involved in cell wall biosynthesis
MLSVIIPARDEEKAIQDTIRQIREALDSAAIPHEIIVVDDGSTDRTGELAAAEKVSVLRHPISGGYGRSLKDGILSAKYDLIAITDADGTYPNKRLPDLFKLVTQSGYDMAIGARTGPEYRGSFLKMPARRVFLWLSEYATGRKIDDINSGLRVFRKDLAVRYMHTIGDKFSFTTTITLAAMLNGYFVCYVPIEYYKRVGRSHIRYWRDSLRSLQIIIENILYYNPLKLFLLLVNALFALTAIGAVSYFTLPDRVATLLGWMAVASFPAAFVVAAIGLAADLSRMARVEPRR